jgi:hypothetical protein
VSGADPVAERPGFKAMLDRCQQWRARHSRREPRQVCARSQCADHRARLSALARGRAGAGERARAVRPVRFGSARRSGLAVAAERPGLNCPPATSFR